VGILAAVLLVSTAGVCLQAAADAGHDHGSVQPDGRFTPNVDGAVFPPQPRDLSNVRNYSPGVELNSITQEQGIELGNANRQVSEPHLEAVQAAERSTEVQALLGSRYTLLQTARVRKKTGPNKHVFRVEYFSRSTNKTVIVESVNGVITDVASYAAADRQPPLGEMEKSLAIEIARQYWIERDEPRVTQLEGYAIQTYQPDGSHYATRVAYVSFHVQSPEPPELITWVDLSNERVFRAEVER